MKVVNGSKYTVPASLQEDLLNGDLTINEVDRFYLAKEKVGGLSTANFVVKFNQGAVTIADTGCLHYQLEPTIESTLMLAENGRVERQSYSQDANPPVYHRKCVIAGTEQHAVLKARQEAIDKLKPRMHKLGTRNAWHAWCRENGILCDADYPCYVFSDGGYSMYVPKIYQVVHLFPFSNKKPLTTSKYSTLFRELVDVVPLRDIAAVIVASEHFESLPAQVRKVIEDNV